MGLYSDRPRSYRTSQGSVVSGSIKRSNTKRAYRLDAPVEIIFEIRSDDTGLERRETRYRRELLVEVYEALGYKVCLFAAIGTLVCRTVHERGVGADKRGTGAPLGSIRRDFTEEE
jgi:hypothetical protein